jgi:hypothetical protein
MKGKEEIAEGQMRLRGTISALKKSVENPMGKLLYYLLF